MKVSNVYVVESVVEMTRHQDRELFEKSLLLTFSEYGGAQEFWLYKVNPIEAKFSLGCRAHLSQGRVVTINPRCEQNLSERLSDQVCRSIGTRNITVVESPSLAAIRSYTFN